MFALLSTVFSGLMSGLVGPLFTWLNNKDNVEVQGFTAAAGADVATQTAWLDYQIKLQSLKLQANNWWAPKLLYIIVGLTASIHTAAIMIDSTFLLNWHIAKLPTPYDTYEGYVIASLFVVSLASGPVSAITAWLHRK